MSRNRIVTAAAPSKPAGTSIVTSPLEVRQLLTRAAEGRTSASLKIRGCEQILQTRLKDLAPEKEGIQLSTGPGENQLNPKSFETLSEKAGSRECMVLIYLQGRSIVGFNAEPVEIQDEGFVFTAPSRLFKIQRRKDVRLIIPSAYEFTIEMDSLEVPRTRIKKRLLDISESGLSFFVLSPREAAFYRKGLVLPRCIVRMQNQEMPIVVKVCNRGIHDRGSKGSGTKIGVEFEQISADDRNFVAQFVYSHAAHLFY